MLRSSLRYRLTSIAVSVGLLLVACQSLTTTKVSSIVGDPRRYVGTTVTVQGEVTEHMNLLALKYFRIEDATGDMYIVTSRALPVEGTTVRVTGKVEELSIGSWQKLVIREQEKKR